MKLNGHSKLTSLLISGLVFLLVFVSCEEDKKDPSVETTALEYLSITGFTASARINEKGDYKILDYGFVYTVNQSASEINTYFEKKISLGKTITKNEFSANFDLGNVQYYPRNSRCYVSSYITNEKGTMYGNVIFKDLLKLQVSSVSPSRARSGDIVTISGQNFSTLISQNSVTFNGLNATIISASSTSLTVKVPDGISTSYYDLYIDIRITSAGQTFELPDSFQLKASPISFTPNTGSWGTYISINGSNLYNSAIYFDDVFISNGNSSTYLSCSIPNGVLKKKFKVYVVSSGEKMEVPGGYFTMTSLSVNPLTQIKYFPGALIAFTGSGFHPSSNYNKLLVDGKTIASNSYASMQFSLPTTILSGEYPVTVTNSLDSVKLASNITIIRPTITRISSSSGYPNSYVTVYGTNLSDGKNTNTSVSFGSTSVSVNSINSDSLKAIVPWTMPGNYSLAVNFGNHQVQCPGTFTVLEPKITSITPASGAAGTTVVINGEGFSSGSYINVSFGNLYASVLSSSNTQINVKVPSAITSGTWVVKVYISSYLLSTTTTFTVP